MQDARKIAPTGIRFPGYIKEALKKAAKGEGRSVNSEVVKRMERSLKEDGLLQA